MTTGLDLEGVHFAYGKLAAVRGVDLSVAPGEILCLLGPSGCGKTTCLRMAAGLERPDRGTIRIAGEVVADDRTFVPPERRAVGLVLQDFALFPHLSVFDNIAFGIKGRDQAARRVPDLLDQVGLADRARAFPHELSGGQQQRIALARALAPEPRVMLMDEPFSSLDVTLRAEVRERTTAVLRARRVPTLIVTHDPDEAMAMADRIAIMSAGRLVQTGTPEALYRAPADAFVMGFFGAANTLRARPRAGRVETPFGAVGAGDVADGAPARVMFYGSALRPADPGEGPGAEIIAVQFHGPLRRIGLALDGVDAPLVMEQPAAGALAVGDRIAVAADLAAFRVFADGP